MLSSLLSLFVIIFGCSLLIMQLQARPSDSENLKNRHWRYRPGIFFYRKFLHPIILPEIRAADSEKPVLARKKAIYDEMLALKI